MYGFYEHNEMKFRAFRCINLNFNAHLHSQVELILVEEGEVNITLGDTSYCIHSGEAVIIFPNVVHSYVTKEYAVTSTILFDLELSGDFSGKLTKYHCINPELESSNLHPDITYCINRIMELNAELEQHHLLKGYFMIVLSRIFENITIEKIRHTDDLDVTQKTLLYLTENFKERLTLEGVAKKMGVSKYYLSHIFSQKIGCGFNQYINSLRIGMAQHLLGNPDISIADIAFECGFESLRTFNRVFKEYAGSSPSGYKKQIQ